MININEELAILLNIFPEYKTTKIYSEVHKQALYLNLTGLLRIKVFKMLPELEEEIMNSDVYELIDLMGK